MASRILRYAMFAVIGVLLVVLIVVVANHPDSSPNPAPTMQKPPCQAFQGSTAQEPVARLLLDARRSAAGVDTPAERGLVLAYAEQIERLCRSTGYSELADGTVQAADAIYYASPETWQQ